MNILMVCFDYKPRNSGEAEYAYSLAVALKQSGHSVTVFAPPASNRVAEDAQFGDSVIRELDLRQFKPLHLISGWWSWPFAMRELSRRLRRVVERAKPDICIVPSYMSWTALAIMRLKIPFIQFLHGEDVKFMVKRMGLSGLVSKRILVTTCKRAKWIFFNSEFSRKNLLLLPKLSDSLLKKSESVGCGVKTDARWTTDRRAEARELLGWKEGPVLLTVGRLVTAKGIDTVIQAMPIIREEYPDCRYVVVGDGPENTRLRELVQKMHLADHVLMTGRVDHETKEKIFSASDVFVLTSQPGGAGEEEGFGIVFLEAHVYGLPVIGTRCGGIPESVEHEGSGLLVKPKDPEALAVAACKLLKSREMRRKMVVRGRERIHTQFNWTSIASRIEKRILHLIV